MKTKITLCVLITLSVNGCFLDRSPSRDELVSRLCGLYCSDPGAEATKRPSICHLIERLAEGRKRLSWPTTRRLDGSFGCGGDCMKASVETGSRAILEANRHDN